MIVVDAALYTLLTNNDTLRLWVTGVHRHMAPLDASYPCIVFNEQSRIERQSFQQYWQEANLIYAVKAVDKNTSPVQAARIASEIDQILTGQKLIVSGWGCLAVTRGNSIEVTHEDGDSTYQHIGALYRIVLNRRREGD